MEGWRETVRCPLGHTQYRTVYKGSNSIPCPQCAQHNARANAQLRNWDAHHPTWFTHFAYRDPRETTYSEDKKS